MKNNIKLKVCGMSDAENIQKISGLVIDYLGFIFYPNSPRNFSGNIPVIADSIIKTGVFVNASEDFILEKIQQYNFGTVQLHGEESTDFCRKLKDIMAQEKLKHVEIIKVFSVLETIDFSEIQPYEEYVDYFLFDTKGKSKGGNGTSFNWKILENYPFQTPYFLSGGIGLENSTELKDFIQNKNQSKMLYALDVNSKFEDTTGIKNLEKLTEFKSKLTN